jgi:hypothetical protein
VLAEGPGLLAQALEVREDLLLDRFEGLVGGELAPVRPAQFRVGEERIRLAPALAAGAFGVLLAFIESRLR